MAAGPRARLKRDIVMSTCCARLVDRSAWSGIGLGLRLGLGLGLGLRLGSRLGLGLGQG